MVAHDQGFDAMNGRTIIARAGQARILATG